MAEPFKPGASAIPATKVEISVSCRNLKDRDITSKSDPMCVLFTKTIGRDTFFEIGRTEMIKDTLNPDFVEKFVMDYYFEESQKLKFEMYDVDSPSSKLNAHDFLGRLECTLGEIVGAPGNRLDKKLTGLSKNAATITVRAEEMANCKEVATIQLRGIKLDKKDFLGKSDPFLVISRGNADGSFTVVHKTEVVKNNLNPTWRPFIIKVRALCHGDYDKPIKFDCYDWDSDGGSHDFIGAFTTNLTELNKGNGTFDLINPKKKAKKGKSYKNSGTINVMSCRIEKDHSFLDFVQGGMEINFTVAIDFTASNGDPRTPQSLHYINPYQPNHYASALGSVGEIIQDYDSDKMFPALGFGAKWPTGQVLHEFYLNGDPNNPYCQGIAGVLDAYQRTLRTVQLWGPTNFSPCINHVAKFAKAYMDGSHYFVLLILTDGVITDMPQTKEAIVKASSLPMSIIIVGVGDADFGAMEELDADNHRLSAYGKYAERDIVQFVPFREFIGGRYGNSIEMSKAYLAKEVLAEVPDQVTGFMKKRGIRPKPPQAAPAPGTAAAKQAPPRPGAPPAGYGQAQQGAYPSPGQPGAPQGQAQNWASPPPGQAPPPQGGQGWAAPPPGQPPPQAQGYGAPPPGGQPPPQAQGYGCAPPGGQPPPQGGQGWGAAPPAGQAPPQGQGAPPPPVRTVGVPPQGQAPYPGQQGGAPAQSAQGAAPYPAGNTGAPWPGPQGAAPYPNAGAPYPGGQGSAPYPAPQGSYSGAPQPGGQGSAPYPNAQAPQAGAPYPQGGAPYPQGDSFHRQSVKPSAPP